MSNPMTFSNSEPRSADITETTMTATAINRPYANPGFNGLRQNVMDAVLVDAVRVTAGPYIPAPLRSRPAGVGPAEFALRAEAVTPLSDEPDLPWIDAFLKNGVDVAESADLRAMEPAPEATQEQTIESAEDWAFDDASQEIRSLAMDLGPQSLPHAASTSSIPSEVVGASLDVGALESALHSPLPMWRDDDLLDIMPVKSSPGDDQRGEHWAAQARRAGAPENHAEAAANLLEKVARRVREGSLTVPGYTPQMSDAAGLAAALSALLNAKS